MPKDISFKTFTPLLALFVLVATLALSVQIVFSWNTHIFLMHLMGFYFLVFGALKALNWNTFVRAYRKYDAVAQYSRLYAYMYPVIELSLGVLFVFSIATVPALVVTIVLMVQKSISVLTKILSGNSTVCACLGGFFAIPITWVTFFEDVLMGLMAISMLVMM